MSFELVLVVALMGFQPQDAIGTDGNRPQYSKVRSMDQYVIALVREGYDRSPTFHELVDALERSNVIVLVQPGICAGGRIRSCLVSVAGSERDRHVRIKIDPQHTIRDGLIAAVAHELQHAVEIAEHPEIKDPPGVVRLYRQIAFGRCREGLSEECETERALETEKTALRELLRRQDHRHPRPPPEFLREHLPGNTAAKDKHNASEARAIRNAGAPTPWPSRIAATCVCGLALGANPTVASDFTHVRSDDASIRALLRSGYERSSTFKRLVDEIESLPGIVYIEPAAKLSRGMDGVLLHAVGGSGDIAMLRVLLKTNLAGDYAVAVLAHELQHVAEVLRAGPPRNGTEMAARFAAHDPQKGDSKFETEEARAITGAVLRELGAKRGR
jgi:hypothetical protein